MRKIIVAIDGYSSCGKSTIARQLARYAGYRYVDTGAMYRAVALFMLEDERCQGTDGIERLVELLPDIHIDFAVQADGSQHTTLNGRDVEQQIRHLEVGNKASIVSSVKAVRQYLVKMQQEMGREKGIVMDGRDIGTIVFPKAELKLFLTADSQVRATRRYNELLAKGEKPVMEDVLNDLQTRDWRDTHREESPLVQAADAIVVDNSHLSEEEQLQKVIELFEQRCK